MLGFFRHFVCVFVFVSSYDFLIAFIISFQNMYGYRGLWSLRAEIMVIFEVMTYILTYSISTYRLGPSGRMSRVKKMGKHDELAKIFSPKNQLHCQCFNTLGKRKNTMWAPLYLLILLHIVFMAYFGWITEQKVSETFQKKRASCWFLLCFEVFKHSSV